MLLQRAKPLFFAGALASLALGGHAHANGQASHVWISKRALTELPEGELDTFLADPALTLMLLNGSMYPDGGYGPVDHPNAHEAAESAHWEPYQDAYRRWIMDTYDQPWSTEAKEHVAFYLGMSAHGMGDQVFDSMFMQRSAAFDPSPLDDFDQFMDYILVDRAGDTEVPQDWVPEESLLLIYDSIGLAYTSQAILDGQAVLRAALSLINAAASVPANITNAEDTYPWASANLLEVSAEGSPPVEAAVVRRYWQVNWDLLHDRGLRRPVLYTFPYDGTANHPIDSSNIESWITIVFSRGLDASGVGNDFFLLVDEDQNPVPTSYQLFYGNDSHVVHLKPTQDLSADTVYTVTVDPGLTTVHDEVLEGWSFRFSTGATAPDPINDDDDWDNPDPPPDPPDPPDPSETGTDGGSTQDTSGEGGCACSTRRSPPSPWLLGLLAVPLARRRRRFRAGVVSPLRTRADDAIPPAGRTRHTRCR